MSLPTQLGAYGDCITYFSRAAANRLGTRIHCHNWQAAQYLRMRLHQSRTLLRKESRRMYPPDHPMWDKSEFDFLVCRLLEAHPDDKAPGTWWVYIERHGQTILAIEDLSEDPADPDNPEFGSLRHDVRVFEQRQLTYLPAPPLRPTEDIEEGDLS